MNKPKEDPMAEFKNIDYRKINEAIPGMRIEPRMVEEETISKDTQAICKAILHMEEAILEALNKKNKK